MSDRVVDFDFYRDRRYEPADPHAGMAKLLEEAPAIFWTPHHGGHWVITGFAEIMAIARNTEVFSSESMGLPPPAVEIPNLPVMTDPPVHAMYREPLAKAFSPKSMMALQGEVRSLATELVERVRLNGRCDFATDIAEQLPIIIFMRLVGMPVERLQEYRDWVNEFLVSGDTQTRKRAQEKIVEAMSALIHARTDKREDDLVSRMLDMPIGGRPITFDEMLSYMLALFVAGLDTVMNAMCFGVHHMARNPELQAELRAHPDRIGDAMEELLRMYAPALPSRILKHDHEAFGVRFLKGDRVLLALAAANIDGREFPEPRRLDFDRENKVHIAFNAGPHRCIGSHLARIELKILYEEILSRLPEFRLDPDEPPSTHGGRVLGWDRLELIWDLV